MVAEAKKFKDIIYGKENGIGMLTLNRPEVMNALSKEMHDEVLVALDMAKHDDDVKVLVITGAGRAFCAGMDIKARVADKGPMPSSELSVAQRRNFLRNLSHRINRSLVDFDKPYIAAVNGAAVGAGMDIASMCDIRIASDKARFGMGFVRMGLVPDSGCYLLPRIVGVAKACELIWTGKIISAEEALEIGYVSKVAPHHELMDAALGFAGEIAKGPPVAIQLSKRLIYRCLDLDLNVALEACESAENIALSTEDAKEGPRAWMEKREPVFKGR